MSTSTLKKITVVGSIVTSLAVFLFGQSDPALWILWPFTIFAIIAYFSRGTVFKIWLYVSILWIFISIVLISLMGGAPSDGWGVQGLAPGFNVFAILNSLYVAISVVLIFGHSLWSTKQKHL